MGIHTGSIDVSQSTDPVPAGFYGVNVSGSISVGEYPWKTVSMISHARQQFVLQGTQKIQLVARPAT